MSFFSKKLNKRFNSSLSRGFSILELMVVLAIFAIMTGILIADIPNFREKSSLDLTVNEVATYIRGAQVYGAAQKGGVANAGVTYGVHFDKGSSSFYLFKDKYFNPQSSEETYTLNNFKIADILVRHDGPVPGTSVWACPLTMLETSYQSNAYTENIGTALEAAFSARDSGGSVSLAGYDYADLKVRSLRDSNFEGCLRIYRNGQIAPISCDDQSFKANCPAD